MRIRREAVARDMAQRKMDVSAQGTFNHFKYDIQREYLLLKKFRRSLFHIELGPEAALELERIKRLEMASVNTGLTQVEKTLFSKLMKAKLQAVVEAAAETPTKKTRKKKKLPRQKCQYCKKRHPGGPANCRKKKADEKAAKSLRIVTTTTPQKQQLQTPPQPSSQAKKRSRVQIARPDESKATDP